MIIARIVAAIVKTKNNPIGNTAAAARDASILLAAAIAGVISANGSLWKLNTLD